MRSYLAADQMIQVEFRRFPALLWLGGGYEVRVGGRVFSPRLGRWPFSMQPWTEFDVEIHGKRVSGMVRDISPWWALIHRRYSLVVGLSELARDAQPIRGLSLAFLSLLAVAALLVLAACGAYSLVLMKQGLFHGDLLLVKPPR